MQIYEQEGSKPSIEENTMGHESQPPLALIQETEEES